MKIYWSITINVRTGFKLMLEWWGRNGVLYDYHNNAWRKCFNPQRTAANDKFYEEIMFDKIVIFCFDGRR